MAEWGGILDQVAKGHSKEVTFQQKSEERKVGHLGEEHRRQKNSKCKGPGLEHAWPVLQAGRRPLWMKRRGAGE